MVNDRFKNTVIELNKCLDKNYNLISFDSLSPEQLIQVLCDVLAKVDPSYKIDVQQEESEDVTVRLLDVLRVLKYKPATGISGSSFRLGLIQGEKKVIHPILEWLLNNLEDVRKRAYLARFLVKIEVPPEILGDPDVSYLFEQYESAIEEFKTVHKESEALKGSGTSVGELKSDIAAMEGEKEIVSKKIGKLQKRIENNAGKTELLESAKNLRKEKEREKELSGLEVRQRSDLLHEDQRLRRLELRLNELRRSASGASPRALLRRLEEESSVNGYISKQKLPQEIRTRQAEVEILEAVQNESDLTRSDVEELNEKIRKISQEINETIERQLAGQNPGEDKNAPFRQQAAIIGRKKENKAEQLSDLRSRLSSVEEDLEEKRNRLKELAGDTVLRGEEFKKYVNKLRGRSSVYKKNRAELAALKAEAGVLSRTLEVLCSRDKGVLGILAEKESERGIMGFRETKKDLERVSEAKADLDSIKGKTLEEMSATISELSRRISGKKSQLAPVVAELRPLREKFRELSDEHEQKKRIYDATASGLENSTRKLEKEVEKLKSEVEETEEKIRNVQTENRKAKENMEKAAREVKLYVSASSEGKKQTLRDQLNQKINEQEKVRKQLMEAQKTVKENQSIRASQVEHWKDLENLMECKIKCMEDSKNESVIIRREKGAETLILPQ